MKLSTLIISNICCLSLAVVGTLSASAGTPNTGDYQSQGSIIFDNATANTADDVTFDSSDFGKIDSAVTSGKESVVTAINNATGKTVNQVNGVYSFDAITSTLNTIANNGAVTESLNAGASYTIPAGYHNGSGKVTANSLASQTVGTAKTEDLTKGATAWVDGTKLTGTGYGNVSKEQVLAGKTFSSTGGKQTGTMINNGGQTVTAATVTRDTSYTYLTLPENAYYNTQSKVKVENSKVSGSTKTKVLYNGAGGTINLTIPNEYQNGTLIVQASHDNRHAFSCEVSGKTSVYSYHGNNYLQSYFGMDVDIFQLNGDTSLTVAVQCSGFTVTVIDKKVTPTYVSTEASLSAREGEEYLCIYTRDYRNVVLVTADSIVCSNLRSAFSSNEALYGVYGTWYCHNCTVVRAIEDTTVTIAGDLVLWLKI